MFIGLLVWAGVCVRIGGSFYEPPLRVLGAYAALLVGGLVIALLTIGPLI